MHNNHIYIGFIKISECHMAGELIGLLRLLRLRDILRATIASKEFKDIIYIKDLTDVCHLLYVCMCTVNMGS